MAADGSSALLAQFAVDLLAKINTVGQFTGGKVVVDQNDLWTAITFDSLLAQTHAGTAGARVAKLLDDAMAKSGARLSQRYEAAVAIYTAFGNKTRAAEKAAAYQKALAAEDAAGLPRLAPLGGEPFPWLWVGLGVLVLLLVVR